MGAGVLPSAIMLAIMLAMLGALAIRLDAETRETPRDHLIIAGGAFLAFSLVFKAVDVLHNLETTRWSSVYGSIGLLAFLAADARVAAHLRSAARGLSRWKPGDQDRRNGTPQ